MYDMPSLWPVVVGDGVDVPRMYHETANVTARERGKEVSLVSGAPSLNQIENQKPEPKFPTLLFVYSSRTPLKKKERNNKRFLQHECRLVRKSRENFRPT